MSQPSTFALGTVEGHVAPGVTTQLPAIRCLVCGLVSCHPRDVAERYCGRCHMFHEDRGHSRPIPETEGNPQKR